MATPPTSTSPRLPINTCEELFEKVKWDLQELQQGWTEYRTFNFVVTAYHLYADWIDSVGTREQRQRKNALPTPGKKLFFVLRDITNASKHWHLDAQGERKKIVSDTSSPIIADWYAYFIAGPVIYVSVDNARPSLPEIAHATVKCLKWILDGGTGPFPSDLDKELNQVFRPI